MDADLYIKLYSDIVSEDLCEEIIEANDTTFKPSTYSTHVGKSANTPERVRMDEGMTNMVGNAGAVILTGQRPIS